MSDAAERTDEGGPLCICGPTPYPGTDAPMEDCPVHYPPPAPLSSPRRTRDEGSDPRDDQTIRAAWDEWSRNVTESFWDVAVLPRRKPGGIEPSILWPVLLDVANRFEIWAHGFRAARLAGEEDR